MRRDRYPARGGSHTRGRQRAIDPASHGCSSSRHSLTKAQPLTVDLTFGGFGEFLDDPVALELGEVIDEEHTVEMVDLVLHAGCEQARGLKLALGSVEIEI